VNVTTNPTEADLLYKQQSQKKSNVGNIKKSSILEKYGGEEHLDGIPSELLLAQTEHYVEYSQQGSVIKGFDKIIPRSKYPEDMYFIY
jgi:pre-mRNA-processing factor SLU7